MPTPYDTFAPDAGLGLSTANFNVLYETNGGTRKQAAAGNVSVRALPWGGGVVVQSAGALPTYRTYKVRLDSASDLTNLLNARGNHGTLTTVETGALAGTLLSVDDTWIDVALTVHEATCEWVMDGIP